MCSDLGPVFTDGTSGGLGSQTRVSPRLSTHPAALENTGGRRRQREWRGTECTPSPRVHGASVSAGGGGERARVRVLARPPDGDGAVEARGTEETGRAGYGGVDGARVVRGVQFGIGKGAGIKQRLKEVRDRASCFGENHSIKGTTCAKPLGLCLVVLEAAV